jgi:multisubunit Na+/H+ antiporter MnhB subunit
MRSKPGVALGVVLLLASISFAHRADAAESAASEAGYGAGSVFTTLLYAPVKTSFCILGGITSVFTLPFGGTDTAGEVATTACGGTWLITPDALRGKEKVRFLGGRKR